MTGQQDIIGIPDEEVTYTADADFLKTVLAIYTTLPETPRRASAHDKAVARGWLARKVPVDIVEAALLMGSLRRGQAGVGAFNTPSGNSIAQVQLGPLDRVGPNTAPASQVSTWGSRIQWTSRCSLRGRCERNAFPHVVRESQIEAAHRRGSSREPLHLERLLRGSSRINRDA